ncbi:MAG: acyl carrier protein [Dehalococcoidia bacterium]
MFTRVDIETGVGEAIEFATNGRVKATSIRPDMLLLGAEGSGAIALDLDSLEALDLTMSLEERFERDLPTDIDTSLVRTVRDLCNLVDMNVNIPGVSR